jgi:hypothetical protein
MSDQTNPDPATAREREAQERAARLERGEAAEGADDGLVAEHRLLARVLAEPPIDPIPDDFAARTAALAESAAQDAGERVEAWLERVLIGLLAVVGVVVAIVYAARWMAALAPRGDPASNAAAFIQWGGAVGGCLVLAWLIDLVTRTRLR